MLNQTVTIDILNDCCTYRESRKTKTVIACCLPEQLSQTMVTVGHLKVVTRSTITSASERHTQLHSPWYNALIVWALKIIYLSIHVHVCILCFIYRSQELCESRGGRPGLPVPNSPYGLCGREATLNLNLHYLPTTGVHTTSLLFSLTSRLISLPESRDQLQSQCNRLLFGVSMIPGK